MAGSRLGALQHRDFRWFFLASSVNRLGSMMTPVAFVFAVLQVDDSATALSQVLAAQMGANVLCLLFGGVVADRFSRRVVLQTTYLTSAVLLGATAFLLLHGQASIGLLTVFGALVGVVGAFSMPAVQGIVPQLVPRSELQQANALVSFVRNGAQVMGPVVGSILAAVGDASWALVIDGACFLVAALLLLPVRLPAAMRSRRGIHHDLREGWTAFVSHTWLWVIVVEFCILNAIVSGAVSVLGPLVAKNTPTLGIAGWGWVMGAQAAGMLTASLLLLKMHLRHPLRTGTLAIATVGLFIAALGAHPVTVPLMVVAFVGGVGIETFGTGWNVALGERIAPEVLSRVSSYDLVGSFVAMPVGMLLYGAWATRWEPGPILVVSGIAYASIAVASLLVRDIRSMERAPEPVDG